MYKILQVATERGLGLRARKVLWCTWPLERREKCEKLMYATVGASVLHMLHTSGHRARARHFARGEIFSLT